MKPLLLLACLGFASSLWGQEASSTNATPLPRPNYRFLFLIDTSSAMSRQKAVTMDAVSRLILSGIGGRIQPGDAWNVWTLDSQLHTDQFPPQRWDPEKRAEIANQVFRFLRSQPFKKKQSPLEKPLAVVAETAELSGSLTVFLFTDGGAPVKGTPFDKMINDIFAKHAAGMRKAKKPFVTVFVAKDGRIVAHAVSPGSDQIYIPPLPKPVAIAKKPEVTGKENATAVPPAPGRTLSAEEISELFRQSQKRQSNTVTATTAPLILRGSASQTNPAVAQTSVKPAIENAAPTLPPSQPAAAPAVSTNSTPAAATIPPARLTVNPPTNLAVNPPASLAVNPPASLAANPPASLAANPAANPPAEAARTEPSAPTGGQTAAPGNAIVPPTHAPNLRPVESTQPEEGDTRVGLAASPPAAQPAVLAQQSPFANASVYLIAAVVLLLVALILAWLYIRSIRYVPGPSIISQSLDRQKK